MIVPRHIGEGQWLTMNGSAGDALLLSSSEKGFTVVVFRANPTMSIELVGFADSTGTDAYNMKLGDRRAEAAKAYLVKHGIAKT